MEHDTSANSATPKEGLASRIYWDETMVKREHYRIHCEMEGSHLQMPLEIHNARIGVYVSQQL